jgi:hypothetical protein
MRDPADFTKAMLCCQSVVTGTYLVSSPTPLFRYALLMRGDRDRFWVALSTITSASISPPQLWDPREPPWLGYAMG